MALLFLPQGSQDRVKDIANVCNVYCPSSLDSIVVWRESDVIVGFAAWRVMAAEAELLALAVLEAKRGAGIGRQLLEAVLKQWDDQALEKGFLEVRASNDVAQSLYRSCGFNAVGRRSQYYPILGTNNFEDALLMARCVC